MEKGSGGVFSELCQSARKEPSLMKKDTAL